METAAVNKQSIYSHSHVQGQQIISIKVSFSSSRQNSVDPQSGIHSLGNMNVCSKFHEHSSSRC